MTWVLTKGMTNLRAQINAWAPGRDHTSDGTIGDTAHQAESSGHNPDKTANAEYKDGDALDEVRAIDVDADLRNGSAMQDLVDHIVGLKPSRVLRYVIFNRRIYEASNGWKSRAYTGASAHTEHAHFSGAYTQTADNDTTFDYRLGEINDMTKEEFIAALRSDNEFRSAFCSAVFGVDGVIKAPSGAGQASTEANPFWGGDSYLTNIYNAAIDNRAIMNTVSDKLDEVLVKLAPEA